MARAVARLRATVWGELLAEFLGTFVLIAFGDGVVAMAVAALNQSGRGTEIFMASGDWLLIAWGWALAVAFGVYVAGGVSGAHINPAVTLALAVKRAFPWPKVAPYMVAQVLGAFVGGALVYLVYHDAISSFEAAKHITRGMLGGAADSTPTFSIFATFPAPYFGSSLVGPVIDQIVGTAFLLMFVLALTDERNQPPKSNLAPLLIGFAVAAIGMSFGANAGYAINPARDFGPRFFAWLAGWGQVAFPGGPRLLVGADRRPADRRRARRLRLRPVRGRHPAGPRRAAGPGRRGVRRDGGGAADDRRRPGRGPGPHRPGALGARQAYEAGPAEPAGDGRGGHDPDRGHHRPGGPSGRRRGGRIHSTMSRIPICLSRRWAR
jgi:glycerol uptake facilitator protein